MAALYWWVRKSDDLLHGHTQSAPAKPADDATYTYEDTTKEDIAYVDEVVADLESRGLAPKVYWDPLDPTGYRTDDPVDIGKKLNFFHVQLSDDLITGYTRTKGTGSPVDDATRTYPEVTDQDIADYEALRTSLVNDGLEGFVYWQGDALVGQTDNRRVLDVSIAGETDEGTFDQVVLVSGAPAVNFTVTVMQAGSDIIPDPNIDGVNRITIFGVTFNMNFTDGVAVKSATVDASGLATGTYIEDSNPTYRMLRPYHLIITV